MQIFAKTLTCIHGLQIFVKTLTCSHGLQILRSAQTTAVVRVLVSTKALGPCCTASV